ncbi:PepSY domain-containing protein [Sphingobium lignivorans]
MPLPRPRPRKEHNMRKWHRWITVFIGIFMLFIALTGLGSHFAAMYARGSFFEQAQSEGPPRGAPASAAPAAGAATAPATAPTTPPAPSSARQLVGLFHHLHSGEFFGPVGVIISLLAGFALLFFAGSGMWMYLQMYRQRRARNRKELFWK